MKKFLMFPEEEVIPFGLGLELVEFVFDHSLEGLDGKEGALWGFGSFSSYKSWPRC